MNTAHEEPDWENICAHVEIGDEHYWPCKARAEELEILAEMREEPPFEKRLMDRAQPIPEPPALVAARKRAEREAKERRETKNKLAQRKEPSRGLSGLLEQLTQGELGKTVLMVGPFVLLGIWWLYSRPSATSDGLVEAWGVRWRSGTQTMERLFLNAQVASQFAATMKAAGAEDILIATQPVRVKPNDARLAKNQAPQAQAA